MTDSDDSADLLQQAQQWQVRLHSGEVSHDDIEAMRRWRASSEAHRRAFAEASMRWSVLRAAAGRLVETTDPETFYRDALVARRRQLTRRAIGGTVAAAAAGFVYAAFHPPLELWSSPAELLADYRTDTGERRPMTLDGDVSVEMNTRTSLARAASQPRQVELIAGEIAVTTASTPFTVTAAGGRTSATIGGFDLRRDGARVSVVCFDGAVDVQCRGGAAVLQRNQRIVYDERGLSGVGTVESGSIDSWRRGLIVFDNQPLSQVVEEINRYRRGRVILLNANLARLPLDASFRLDRIDDAVGKIARLFGAKVRDLPGGIVLLS